jgi:glycosyltransferase involved in cell wall biosynthesis
MKDLLTIIIPCKNEEKYIFNTLYKLNEQKHIRGVNVIIADGGSSDRTLFEISKFTSSKNNLTIKVTAGGGVSYGRNVGANYAKTPYLLFLDADTKLLSNDAIKTTLDKLLNGNTISTCKVKSVSPSKISKLVFWIFNKIQWLMPETFCTGQFFMISKKDFIELGKFDETAQHSEDYLLSRKVPKSKFKIVNKWIGQDDRRFKKMGYINFILLIIKNYINRNKKGYFTKDIGYWI